MTVTVVGNRNTGSTTLNNWDDVIGIQLTIKDPGNYVVFGRVVIRNYDGGSQPGTVWLTDASGAKVDVADLRLGPDSSDAVYLQGSLIVGGNSRLPNVLDLHCTTYKGAAGQFSLFAVNVDKLEQG